jgi:hypothetical protein
MTLTQNKFRYELINTHGNRNRAIMFSESYKLCHILNYKFIFVLTTHCRESGELSQ